MALAEEGHPDRRLRGSPTRSGNATKHYDEDQLVALVSLIALINAANRMSVMTNALGGGYEPGVFS